MFLSRRKCCGFMLAAALGACGVGHPPDDAEGDGGVADADSVVSHGEDAGAADGGAEPDLDTQAGWVPLEGFPPECMMARAEHPEVLFQASFRPCRDMMPGCVEIPPDPRFSTRRFDSKSGYWHDGEHGYFVVKAGRNDSESLDIIADTSGRAFAAWRSMAVPGMVCADYIAVGDGFAAHAVLGYRYPDGMISSREGPQRFFHAPLAEIGQLGEPTFIADEGVFRLGNSIAWIDRDVGGQLPGANQLQSRGCDCRRRSLGDDGGRSGFGLF